jgi:hypothetical protein
MDRRERVSARREIHRRLAMIEKNLDDGREKTPEILADARQRKVELRHELSAISKEVR